MYNRGDDVHGVLLCVGLTDVFFGRNTPFYPFGGLFSSIYFKNCPKYCTLKMPLKYKQLKFEPVHNLWQNQPSNILKIPSLQVLVEQLKLRLIQLVIPYHLFPFYLQIRDHHKVKMKIQTSQHFLEI